MPRITKYKEKVSCVKYDVLKLEKKYSKNDIFSIIEETLEELFPPVINEFLGQMVDIKDVDEFIKGEW